MDAGLIMRRLRAAGRAAPAPQNVDANWFLLTATCPPSTRVQFRGGWEWEQPTGVDNGGGYYYPGGSADLAASGDVAGRDFFFEHAGWYTYWLLAYRGDASVRACAIFYWTSYAGPQEWATAAEAEAAATADFAAYPYPPWQYNAPLGTVILRNNGNTDLSRQFLPVDQANRGRSYIFNTHRAMMPAHEI